MINIIGINKIKKTTYALWKLIIVTHNKKIKLKFNKYCFSYFLNLKLKMKKIINL